MVKQNLLFYVCIAFIASTLPTMAWAGQTNAPRLSNQRFVGTGDQVLDQLTGLVWQRCSLGQKWDAQLGCVGVPKKIWFDEAKQLQSQTWRIPGLEELKSIFDTQSMAIADPHAFPDAPATWYWVVGADGAPAVWGVSCEDYEDSCYRGSARAVRMVQRAVSRVKLSR